MKISEVIKNITEIQEPNWVANLSDEEIEKIENQFWLIWNKLKLIQGQEIIEPLEKISAYLTAEKILDGKSVNRRKNVDFSIFYSACIDTIPKKNYEFISPKKKKKKNYDYEFLKLLAKDLNENIGNCEEYHDIYEGIGILEDEKVKLFNKYGIQYEPESNDKIELVNIDSIEKHPKSNKSNSSSKEYLTLLEKINKFGIIEPLIVQKKTNYIISGHMRYLCCKELGINRISVIRKEFKFDVISLINFNVSKGRLLSEQVNAYIKLNQKMKKFGYKQRTEIMGGVTLREYLFKQTGISQTQVYRLEFIERNSKDLYQKVLMSKVSITKAYFELKK